MSHVAYFAIGFGQPGCIPDSTLGACAVNTRRELMDAMRDAVAFYDIPKTVLATVSWRDTWRHAKRYGLSSVSLELATPSMSGCLLLMGLTEEEYQRHVAEEE